MRKLDHAPLSPGELHRELLMGAGQLGQLAVALGLPTPAFKQELERLSSNDIVDLWTASRASIRHVDQAWNDNAANMIHHYLETVSNSPDASVPSS